MNNWFRQHASAIYVGILCAVGIVGFTVGFFLDAMGHKTVGSFCTQLFGSLLAVALTAVFFSLPDLRESVAKALGDLLSRGDFIRYLTPSKQGFLAKAMLESRSKLPIGSINADLFDHIDSIQMAIATSVYYTNYRQDKKIRRIKPGETTVEHLIRRSYRLHPGFNRPLPVKTMVGFRIQWSAPEKNQLIPESWCSEFKSKIGNERYGIKDANISKAKKDDTDIWSLTFEKEMTLEGSIDVEFSIKVFGSTDDPVDICIARAPCLGFEVSLNFEDGLLFDCAFLGAAQPLGDHFNRGAINYENNGITYRTNDWVMPGEGVVVYYQLPSAKTVSSPDKPVK